MMVMIGPDAAYHFVDLAQLVDEHRRQLLGAVHEQILVPAFPSNEMTPLDAMQRMWSGTPPRLAVHAAIDSRGEPVGCAVAEWFPGSAVLLLAYLAVRADRRGDGIGTSLISRAVRDWAAAYRPALVVAEVEDPRAYPCTPGQDPLARLRLYLRLGAQLLKFRYIQPELNPGAGRVRDLLLMVVQECSAGTIVTSDGMAGVPSATVLSFVEEYYHESEGEAHYDTEFLTMIRTLDDRTIIPLSNTLS